VGGASFFFTTKPRRALLSDLNEELIDIYLGIRRHPERVWRVFRKFPSTKRAYYQIRKKRSGELHLPERAARTLFLNRTCFKGMWRHNQNGEFNVGYGGQDRRWVVTRARLLQVSRLLQRASLRCADFERVLSSCKEGDFIFLDPPYRPGRRDMVHDHYRGGKFTFDDHKRLAKALKRASKRGARWAMTTSGHPAIVRLFARFHIEKIPKGTGDGVGQTSRNSGEVLVRNFMEERP
jgi:DNA adenine methylase